ncbi:MAG TPA: four helix bundle protein [Candidatus Saccharimonadales bacterium]|nr:four helix bundle protein [Candidatus Saccharimonadales bacterium]
MLKQTTYDLEERTTRFGEDIVVFARIIPKDVVTLPIINQLVKAGTSVGANYCEADDAESRRDFIHKLGIAKKEARETSYWLRVLAMAVPELKDETQGLRQEAKELNLIFNAIIRSADRNELKKMTASAHARES